MGPRNHMLDGNAEELRDVSMATHCGMQFDITGSMAFDWL